MSGIPQSPSVTAPFGKGSLSSAFAVQYWLICSELFSISNQRIKEPPFDAKTYVVASAVQGERGGRANAFRG